MSPSRRQGFLVLGWLALVGLSLRPVAPFERALDTLVAPARIGAELTVPISWLRASELRAAEEAIDALRERDAEERDELERALRAAALPPDPELLAGRVPIDAEVVGRTVGDLDELEVRLPEGALVHVGLPVVVGRHYVGRVASVGRDGSARVRLVTARDFFVGGAVRTADGREVWLAVGGLDRLPGGPPGAGAEHLAVHNPSDRGIGDATPVDPDAPFVLVREPLDDERGYARLAEGFRLGRLVRRGPWLGVEPGLDFRAGLYQVVVLAPVGAFPPGEIRDVLSDGEWVPVRALTCGDPSATRSGLKVAGVALRGVGPGAAVVHGTRLFGRVARTGPVFADVELLSDPGFELVALARLASEDELGGTRLHALGRLVSLGADEDGAIRCLWRAVVPIDPRDVATALLPDDTVAARVFSGAGEPGLPRGLYVGDALLPVGPAPRGGHVVRLHPGGDGLGVSELWVRTGDEVGAEAP